MATIFTAPQPQQQQQQQQQQPQAFAQNNNQDPLFEALVKYITQAPGASSATASQLQEIIDSHSAVPGGRAYLEGLVTPDVIQDPRIWNHVANAQGFVSTNMDSLTLVFTVPEAHLAFKGRAAGFFGPSVWEFSNGKYYWDNNFERDTPVTIEIRTLPQSNQMVVAFFPEVSIPPRRSIAELVIPNVGLRLPPQGAEGTGRFTLLFGPN